jgi:AraC-like DNA-binding protein
MEIHIELKNLVEIRKKFDERYTSPDIFPVESEPELGIEDEFMSKVRQILETRLDDDEYCISQLCKELAVSHTQLYHKFKSASNQTIARYFKTLRLYRSKILLSSTKMNVTEVAFAAGFKNLSYFSREFTQEFGKNPKEFRTLSSRKLSISKNEIGTDSKTSLFILS